MTYVIVYLLWFSSVFAVGMGCLSHFDCYTINDNKWINGTCENPKLSFKASVNNSVNVSCFDNQIPNDLIDCFLRTNALSFKFVSCHVNYDLQGKQVVNLQLENSQLSLDGLKNLKSMTSLSLTRSVLKNLTGSSFVGFQLEHLAIVNYTADYLPSGLFLPLKSLTSLTLTKSRLSEISDETFNGLIYLKRLDLSWNQLRWISRLAMKDLIELEELDLSHNELFALYPYLFRDLKKIKMVIVNDNKLHLLPNGLNFPANNTLLRLDFSWNVRLQSLPDNLLEGLNNLENLNLENCSLKSLSAQLFKPAKRLQRLNLARNQLRNLPEELFSENHFLKYLDLSRNRFSSLPESLFRGTPKLREIQLSYNNFENIPGNSIPHLSQLRVVNVSNNYLTKFRSVELSRLMNLEILDVSHNFIKEAQIDFWSGYKDLKVLNMSHNRFRSIPKIITNFREKLKILDLDYNSIERFEIPSILPYDVSYFVRHNSIRWIDINITKYFYNVLIMPDRDFLGKTPIPPVYYLSENNLTCDCSLKKFIDFTVQNRGRRYGYPIQVLDLDQMQCSSSKLVKNFYLKEAAKINLTCPIYTSCPSACECYSYVPDGEVHVNCSGVGFVQIPSVFPANTSLIDLTGNLLTALNSNSIPSSILKSLKQIDVSNNLISNISWSSEQVIDINLSNNQLRLPPSGVSRMSNVSLFLKGNPFICDCPNFKLKKWLEDSEAIIADSEHIACFSNQHRFVVRYTTIEVLCSESAAVKNCSYVMCLLLVYLVRVVFYFL